MGVASGHSPWMPAARSGRWSIRLEVAFVLMFFINIPVNLYIIRPSDGHQVLLVIYVVFVIFMLACGLAGGALGLMAVTKQRERSPLVWVSTLCGLFVLLLILNELIQGLQYMSAG